MLSSALHVAAGGAQPASRVGMVWIGLADDVQILAPHRAATHGAAERTPEHTLGAAFAVHLGGVEQAVADVDGAFDQAGLTVGLAGAFAQAPGARCRARGPAIARCR